MQKYNYYTSNFIKVAMKIISKIGIFITIIINQIHSMDISKTDDYNIRQYQLINLAKELNEKITKRKNINLIRRALVNQLDLFIEVNEQSEILVNKLLTADKESDQLIWEIIKYKSKLSRLITLNLLDENSNLYRNNDEAFEHDKMEEWKKLNILDDENEM